MHKRMLIGAIGGLLLILSGRVSAQGALPTSVIDALEQAGTYTQILSIFEAAGLTDVLRDPNTALTLLVPRDEVFAATTLPTMEDAEAAERVAGQHIVPGLFTFTELLRLTQPLNFATATGAPITIRFENEVIINQNTRLVTTDMLAANGVIHTIDGVILPPPLIDDAPVTEESGGLLGGLAPIGVATMEVLQPRSLPAYDLLASNIGFGTLVAAVDAAEPRIQSVLQGGRYTVFAPQDANFTLALQTLGLNADTLITDAPRLNRILSYHVVPWRYTYEELAALDGALVGTLLPGTALIVRVNNGVVTINNAPISQSTFNPSDAALHPLAGVLIPPEPVSIVG